MIGTKAADGIRARERRRNLRILIGNWREAVGPPRMSKGSLQDLPGLRGPGRDYWVPVREHWVPVKMG